MIVTKIDTIMSETIFGRLNRYLNCIIRVGKMPTPQEIDKIYLQIRFV